MKTRNFKSQRFYANMAWFEPADQPGSLEDLPKEFAEAKKLWSKNPVGNLEKIINLLSPFVGARFLPTNLANWEELFVDSEGEGMVEIAAASVNVVGIEFKESPIPICKAEAFFEVKVTREFAATDLEEWQNNNSRFTDGVAFFWNVPMQGELEDLDFTFGDNQGVECSAVE